MFKCKITIKSDIKGTDVDFGTSDMSKCINHGTNTMNKYLYWYVFGIDSVKVYLTDGRCCTFCREERVTHLDEKDLLTMEEARKMIDNIEEHVNIFRETLEELYNKRDFFIIEKTI